MTNKKKLPVFWLSWWDDPNGKPGKQLTAKQEEHFEVWVSGYRYRPAEGDDEVEHQSMCARVEAETERAAWALVDIMYPGASTGEVRFAHQHEPGWQPGDRFPSRKLRAAVRR